MTPQEIRRALRSAILAGRLTADEASAFLAALRSGEAAVIPSSAGSVDALLTGALAAGVVRALVATGLLRQRDADRLLASASGTRATEAGTPAARRYRSAVARLARTPYGSRVEATIRSVGGFDRDAFRLAARVTGYRGAAGFTDPGPRIGPAEFHRLGRQRIVEEHVLNAASAMGRQLNADDLARLRPRVAEELARFDAFAAEVAARETAGRPYSRRYVMERLRMYEGNARATFYEWGEAEQARRDGQGTVYDVVGADDGRTCGPCSEGLTGGPYLPGEGFVPGRDCRGRGKCRHRRVPRYDAATFVRLSRQKQTA